MYHFIGYKIPNQCLKFLEQPYKAGVPPFYKRGEIHRGKGRAGMQILFFQLQLGALPAADRAHGTLLSISINSSDTKWPLAK